MNPTDIEIGKTYIDNGGRRCKVREETIIVSGHESVAQIKQDTERYKDRFRYEVELDDGQVTSSHPDLLQFEATGEMRDVVISNNWAIYLPEHRAARGAEWDTWEKERLASMHKHLTACECRHPKAAHNNGQSLCLGDVDCHCKQYVKTHPFLYDIGAEEGDFPGLFAKWGCRIGLIEPQPLTWPNMKVIWEANELPIPEFSFVGFAGDVNTESYQEVFKNSWPPCADGEVIGNHGFLNLSERGPAVGGDTQAITIDRLAEMFGPPDALTIDVEGADLEVIMGAQDTLRDHKPQIWISVHPEFMFDMYGHYSRDLFNYIECWGYKYELLAFDHEWHVRFWHPEKHVA